jgi:hypothetical protein
MSDTDDTTTNLGLPYLDPSQAQPEVKINLAWDILDNTYKPLSVKQVGDSPAGDVFQVTTIKFNGATVELETPDTALVTFSGGGGSSGGRRVIALRGRDGEAGRIIPGRRGLAGAAGARGRAGIGMRGRDGDRGQAGVPGRRQGSMGGMSIVGGQGLPLTLLNDAASPGNNYYYGTNASGAKGWILLGSSSALPFNVTFDTHAAVPTGVGLGPNDEFEFGSTIDTTGARYSGATAWTLYNDTGTAATSVQYGALQTVTISGGATAGAGYLQPTAASGNFTYVAKIRGEGGFGIYNSSTWKGYYAYITTGGAGVTLDVQSETRNFPTGAYTFNSISGSGTVTQGWVYLSIAYNGTSLIFSWSPTGNPGDFTAVYTIAVSSWIGTPQSDWLIGFVAGIGPLCDFFRRTA